MKLHPRLSRAALELVMRFEAFQPKARPAAAGGWTLGYGHTRSARENAEVSRADGEALLLYDLSIAAGEVEQALFAPVSQRQFEALTAFCFNVGAENFRHSSALARINAGAHLEAADEIERWRHAELGAGAQVVDALVRRRAAEKAHFLGLPEGFSKSPSAVLRPLAGSEGFDTAPPGVVTSATLDVANGIQARLRELVPEPRPAEPPSAEPAETASSTAPSFVEPTAQATEPEAPPFPEPEPEPAPTPILVDAAPYLPPPPPPPPVSEPEPEPANDLAPAPPHIVEPVSSAPILEPAAPIEPVAQAAAPPPAPARTRVKLDRRAAYAVLTGVGVCLLVAAAALILGGKASFTNLGLGVVGALLMAPGVYGLLGPRPPGE